MKKEKANIPEAAEAGATATGDATATPATKDRMIGLGEKIKKMLEPTPLEVVSFDFCPGEIGVPSLEGALRDVNITYTVEEPYQYVRIAFDPQEMALMYYVVEPTLSADERQALETIERVFEKLISTEHHFVLGANREEYLRTRFESIPPSLPSMSGVSRGNGSSST